MANQMLSVICNSSAGRIVLACAESAYNTWRYYLEMALPVEMNEDVFLIRFEEVSGHITDTNRYYLQNFFITVYAGSFIVASSSLLQLLRIPKVSFVLYLLCAGSLRIMNHMEFSKNKVYWLTAASVLNGALTASNMNFNFIIPAGLTLAIIAAFDEVASRIPLKYSRIFCSNRAKQIYCAGAGLSTGIWRVATLFSSQKLAVAAMTFGIICHCASIRFFRKRVVFISTVYYHNPRFTYDPISQYMMDSSSGLFANSAYGEFWKTPNQIKNSPRSMAPSDDYMCHSPPPPNVIADFNIAGNYPLSPIDFEPLPNLFSFGTCQSSTFSKDYPVYKEKNPHDMADVLLSLKHAFVHPSQISLSSPNGVPPPNSPSYGHYYNVSNHQPSHSTSATSTTTSTSPQNSVNVSFGGFPPATNPSGSQLSPASVSFSVHPHSHQSQVNHQSTYASTNPNSAYNCDNYLLADNFGPPNHSNFIGTAQSSNSQTVPQIFPSMSVNVSMNMTMGVPAIAVPPSYNMLESVTSSNTTSNNSSIQHQPNVLGPPPIQMSYSANHHHHHHHGCVLTGTPAGYSFTAEFRPTLSESSLIDESKSNHYNKNVGKLVTGFRPPVHLSKSHRIAANAERLSKLSNENASSLCHSTSGDGGISKINLCRICGKNYARPSTLKTHMRTHSGEKPYRCNNCDKSFSQAANLTAHVRTHSGEKPFRCPICDRRFSQSSSVTTHMRTHSGERPYGCRMCKKAFSDSSTLTKHLRIHSGEKPYQCKLCLLRFSQSGNLNRHMRVHSNSN
ncbi:hypothetical protein CHUAL_012414 [Chamberlinius hualienensis]